MKRTLLIFKIILSFLLLPFSVSNGTEKTAYQKIKKMMIAANLL